MSLPDGYKLVPVEPSPSMLAAYLEADGAVSRYAAMLKAAPVPPIVDGPPSAWVNGEQLRLCAKSPRHDEPENPMLHNLPRNIAGSALRGDYCDTPLYAVQPASESDRLMAQLSHAKRQYQEMLDQAIGLRRDRNALRERATKLEQALKFYADGDHLILADADSWDTCSGEPVNFLHDEAGTASVEDGSIAKAALKPAAECPNCDTGKITQKPDGAWSCNKCEFIAPENDGGLDDQ